MSNINLMFKHLLISAALLTTAFATPIKFTFSGYSEKAADFDI
jgi:hypothetical protein